MAQVGGFKKYKRGQRVVDAETNYSLGMNYIESPIPEGQCKLLVNYAFHNQGESLKPRGGMQHESDIATAVTDLGYYIHHIDSTYIDDADNSDAILMRYVVAGKEEPSRYGVDFNTCVVFIEDPLTNVIHKSALEAVVGAPILKHTTNRDWKSIHGTPVTEATPLGLHISIENNAYMLYKDGADIGIGRLYITKTAGTYTHRLDKLTAKDVTPYEAVNYGYNMLLDSPYTFTNTLNPAGNLVLQGLLPYDADDKLKFNAKVGEDINFKLIYKYPSGSPTYKVQWEVQELGAVTGIRVLQEAANSATYTAGDPIEFSLQPPFKQFSVIVKVYDSADLAKPLKVLTLASYYLSADGEDANKNIDTVNYSLGTATGTSKFMNKTVLWGVAKAKNTLFMSDINDPSYFPFPQGAEPMGEDIIHCTPLLENFLVFTETRLIALTPDWVTGGFTRKTIQENLNMNYYDRNTIKVVRNMVYFKSNNYYYMVVPNNTAGPGELQLAPISKPIERLLDNFDESIKEILDEAYNVDFTLNTDGQEWSLELIDFYNYLDNSQMKNIYKYKLSFGATIYYLEIVLAYDTLLRNWSMFVWETNRHRLIPYRQMVTESTVYANLYQSTGGELHLQLIKRNDDSVIDTFKLDSEVARTVKNHQLIDTGKRLHVEHFKKRFRELQVFINNLTGSDLEFYANFIIDDDDRKPLFEYTTEVVSDPLAPNYGQLFISRSYVDPEFVQGTTILGLWRLGLSALPPLTVSKIRVDVSGKGYSGRLKLLSVNETMYELLSNAWVYREMNAR